jgi:hypothetical protein
MMLLLSTLEELPQQSLETRRPIYHRDVENKLKNIWTQIQPRQQKSSEGRLKLHRPC